MPQKKKKMDIADSEPPQTSSKEHKPVQVDLNNKPRKSSDGLSSKHKVAKPKATNQQKATNDIATKLMMTVLSRENSANGLVRNDGLANVSPRNDGLASVSPIDDGLANVSPIDDSLVSVSLIDDGLVNVSPSGKGLNNVSPSGKGLANVCVSDDGSANVSPSANNLAIVDDSMDNRHVSASGANMANGVNGHISSFGNNLANEHNFISPTTHNCQAMQQPLSSVIGGAYAALNMNNTLNSCDNCKYFEQEMAWCKGQISYLWESVQNLQYQSRSQSTQNLYSSNGSATPGWSMSGNLSTGVVTSPNAFSPCQTEQNKESRSQSTQNQYSSHGAVTPGWSMSGNISSPNAFSPCRTEQNKEAGEIHASPETTVTVLNKKLWNSYNKEQLEILIRRYIKKGDAGISNASKTLCRAMFTEKEREGATVKMLNENKLKDLYQIMMEHFISVTKSMINRSLADILKPSTRRSSTVTELFSSK